MYYFWEFCRQILLDMRTHKVRSLLALFGIVWGTIAVVVLLALGQGFFNYNKKNIEALANGAILIFPGKTSIAYSGLPQGQVINFRLTDVLNLPQQIKSIDKMTFELRTKKNIGYEKKFFSQRVIGINSTYTDLQKLSLVSGGRLINSLDMNNLTRVAIIGAELKKMLFGDHEALNKTITLSSIPFRVIGVLTDQDNNISFGDPRASTSVFIPFTTFQAAWGFDTTVSKIIVLPKQQTSTQELKQAVLNYFATRYSFDPQDTQAAFMPDINQLMEFFTLFFRAVQSFLGFCGMMTLGVGGVGVANIMFLIISERTREIGLRMALGARYRHILQQILLEALLIVMIGGLIGLVLSFAIIGLLQTVSLPIWLGVPVISYSTMIITTTVLAIIGVCTGIFPARRAAAMDPVVALSC